MPANIVGASGQKCAAWVGADKIRRDWQLQSADIQGVVARQIK
nr:hypothetical protein [Oceanicoccus sp. KOV_DT_Chl]